MGEGGSIQMGGGDGKDFKTDIRVAEGTDRGGSEGEGAVCWYAAKYNTKQWKQRKAAGNK
jgi:hypothetical protein